MSPNFVDLLLDAVFMVDAYGRIHYVNAACERILGYTPEEMVGKALIDFVFPEDRAKTWEEGMKVMAGQARIGFENRYVRKDGGLAHIMWSACWSEADQMRIGVARDVTERKHAEAVQAAIYAISEAAHAAANLVTLFREIHFIIAKLLPVTGFAVAMYDEPSGQIIFPYQLDSHGNCSLVQEVVARQLCAEVINERQAKLLPGQTLAARSDMAGATSTGASWLAVPLMSQSEAVGALVAKSYPDAFYSEKDKELLQFVSTQVSTAIERKKLHAELLRMAQHDDLTGLPNRRLFHDRIAGALARTRRERGKAALLYIDLDDFKQINDSLGHAAGDLILREVAHRLKQCVREEDTVARLGGDEFVVLLEHMHQAADATLVADKIRTAMDQELKVNGSGVRMRPSIGLALFPEHGSNVEELLKHADDAMYADKRIDGAASSPTSDLPPIR